jgi:deoxyribodipyrimidine photolyase-related protein
VAAEIALVLGDQLTLSNPALARIDRARDSVLMMEAAGEARHVWSHKARIALFLSAMRHFAGTLREAGFRVHFLKVDDPLLPAGLPERLDRFLADQVPARIWMCEAGERRLAEAIAAVAAARSTPLSTLPDTHFLISTDAFSRWAGDKASLRMEFFYRHLRRQTGVLMEGDEPAGGQWNFDAENRKGFGAKGPGVVPLPPRFPPDAITQDVFATVERMFGDHPGSLESFAWPVTRPQALEALQRFVDERLAAFGPHQDALWSNEPFLWHSLLSTSLNLKLLDPREVIDAAVGAWHERRLPLASVEGFVRQVLGWREFIRGVYWHWPDLGQLNHFEHHRPLPAWFWTGETSMNCLRDTIGQTLHHGYAHHIQRLMITGNFALLAELSPQAVCDWYLAVYVDAVEWVELPNTAGMALHACGPRFTSKPYIASGAYVKRMSNHCKGCRYDPGVRVGPGACPITLLYWAFVDKHAASLSANPRTVTMTSNLKRLSDADRHSIRTAAQDVLAAIDTL